MKAVITATEWRIRQALSAHAEAEQWPVPPQLLGRIAKLAAQAAGEGRPVDPAPGTTTAGRKRAGKGPGRPSAGRRTVSGSSGTPGPSEALQVPSVARETPEGPALGSERPSKPRNSREGRDSRPASSAALTDAPEAFGGAR